LTLTVSASAPDLHSFPTRRSSDLQRGERLLAVVDGLGVGGDRRVPDGRVVPVARGCREVLGSLAVVGEEPGWRGALLPFAGEGRSEEHTSELQSRENLVCRLLLEK